MGTEGILVSLIKDEPRPRDLFPSLLVMSPIPRTASNGPFPHLRISLLIVVYSSSRWFYDSFLSLFLSFPGYNYVFVSLLLIIRFYRLEILSNLFLALSLS